MPAPSTFRIILAFCVMTVIWGTTWAAIRIGLEGIPPFTGVALRFGIAGIVLLALALRSGIALGKKPREKSLWAANALLSFSVSYGIVYWCEQWVPSGLASVLFATFPLFVAIIGHYVLPEEKLTVQGAAGIFLGFAGVAVIFSEDFAVIGGRQMFIATAVMLISPLAAAVASVIVKKWGAGIHPLSLTAVPMLLGSAVMGVVAAVSERHIGLTLDRQSVGALLYLAIFGSAVTFTLYFWLLSHVAANRLALVAFTTPVIAIAVGAAVLDEPITVLTLIGSACVLFGVALAATAKRR
jgi:drug/metabolite transporter (DMT)-like permease